MNLMSQTQSEHFHIPDIVALTASSVVELCTRYFAVVYYLYAWAIKEVT